MASGAQRSARKRRFEAKVAAGLVPAPRVTHYQSPDIQAAVQDELAAHRVALANQRARVRGAKLAAPKRAKSEANTQTNERRDALLEHLNETP